MDEQPGCFDKTPEEICDFLISPVEYQIFQIAKNDQASVQSLGEAIAGEPLLAVRLLRVANLISGLPQVLSSVAQSISILGLDQLKALTLGISFLSLSRVLTTEKNVESADGSVILRQIWEHSVGCATFAGRIATKVGNVSPRAAFVAGFLHDTGRLLFYRYSKEHYVKSVVLAMEKGIPLTEAETLVSGVNHQELGAVWSRRLGLPSALIAVIRYHHERPCMLPDFVTDEVRKVVTVVRLADLSCENQGIGSGGEKADEIEDLWRAFNLRPEEMTDELRIIQQEVVAARETFGFRREDTGKGFFLRRSAIELEGVSFSEPQDLAANEWRGQVIRFAAHSDDSPKAGQNPPSKRLTILVVEDHGLLCEMLSLYLIRCGYHVRAADNGKVALDVLSKESVDLVLLDLMLPRMDGFTLLKRVRETHEDAKPYIIVVPVGASEKDRNRVLEFGANEYMPKPFHMARLLERIQAVEKYLLN